MSTTTSSAMPSATSDTGSGGGGGGGPSSPLLFFVALGFGVVFTNLWIIVGVKYCFRYNQRNRARMAGEDPDAVDMATMPRQRRRREKKLMTIDEVNEKFPLVKYKSWRSTRADQGLPTAGGITSSSRPASLRNEVRDVDSTPIEKVQASPTTLEQMSEKINVPDPSQLEHAKPEVIRQDSTEQSTSVQRNVTTKPALSAPEPAVINPTGDDDLEGPDQIQTAIPPENLPDPGDTCAICIDTIEDDDDIRGLSCGHAFHASCVDPWLTSRRACCPLCKADYYTPKPRPEGATADDRRGQPPLTPFSIISAGRPGHGRGRSRIIIPGVFFAQHPNSRSRGRPNTNRRFTNASAMSLQPTPEVTHQDSQPATWRNWRSHARLPSLPALSRIRRGRGNESGSQPEPEVPGTTPTPAQLEAGTR